jgi:hypothetical protein
MEFVSWNYLNFAMNHVRFMISPELYVVQEALKFDIIDSNIPSHLKFESPHRCNEILRRW